MKFSKISAALVLATVSTGVLAGGPLYIHEPTMQPYKWDTSKGSIPVWTDGGQLIKDKDGNDVETFTVLEKGTVFNIDVTLPDGTIIPANTELERDYTFLTIEQANAVTANAVKEWSDVETSTFEMSVQGTIFEKTGIADVTAENVDQIYGVENGYGFWVNYDTDGGILENYFGVSRDSVLGIAFPEWADEETGEIIEATALMNGWYVDINDTDGTQVGGVFTHEFGHAINMSHSQANGHLVYMSASYSPQYDGVPGCTGVTEFTSSSMLDFSAIETMFPFINVRSSAGSNQHTINVKDDIVNISDLYPTEEYKSKFGSIRGKLFTKEGVEYSGINLIARNLDNPYEDVITQQSGNMTQGRIGPDGSFTINGLTPGARYALYTQEINTGGYPTQQTNILSEAEYWNEDESANPSIDNACALTEIVVSAGETKQVEMFFNGYQDGIQYTPLVSAFVVDHAKNGKKALGTTSSGIPFLYDSATKSFDTLVSPDGYALLSSTNTAMNKTATKAAITAHFNDNGIMQGGVWDINSGHVSMLEDLTGNSCTLSSQQGDSSHSIWDMDDAGKLVVGNTRFPYDGTNRCAEGEGARSVGIPTVWDVKTGKANLLPGTKMVDRSYNSGKEIALVDGDTEIRRTAWARADRISGNGETITGSTNGFTQIAWVNGEFVDTYTEFGAIDNSVISENGRYVAFGAIENRRSAGVKLWDTVSNTTQKIGSLRWCDNIPAVSFWTNYCDLGYSHEELVELGFGLPSIIVLDANDDLSVITGRAGSGLAGGFVGAIYLEGIGWMSTEEFFGKQGVSEAKGILTDNMFGLSANGSEIMAGVAGLTLSIEVDANKAFVCDNGRDRELSFPKQVVEAVKLGAEFGRCAHLDD
ncbi:hypothetical protein L1D46_20075 [Pseudoalteromonas sp. Isolate3]|uniref:hypothetical protein n=1 Tax=Pseudoalteromonas sp. Isolate3 TaxID=2908526 RepID=UPI001EFE0F50|nr:hypothetical protein [Pseudoalteromonas sp. Isolate3]MCG9711071.1 hypothetical protein [Pseudoalteromonas sp. Isolate3]